MKALANRNPALPTADTITMGKRIKEARRRAGLTQIQLAGLLGYRDSTSVVWIEKGVSPLPTNKMNVLCHVLSISPNTLMGWNE